MDGRMRRVILLVIIGSVAASDDECDANPPQFIPPYDPTRCHPLNVSLPAVCLGPKWSLNPPCPRCFTNDAVDYTPGAPTTLSPALQTRMHTALDTFLAHMITERPSTHSDSGTVFSGIGGRALLLFKLHAATGNASYLEQAQTYTAAMLKKLPQQTLLDEVSGQVGFQWSHIGMLCVAAYAAAASGDLSGAQHYVGLVAKVFVSAAANKQGRYDDFDSGRSGLLYALRFLEATLPESIPRPLVPRATVYKVATNIIDRGVATGAANGHKFMQWHGPNDNGLWLGQSHGAAGVMQQLLEVPELLANATAVEWLKRTLDHICDAQLPSGNFPTEYYNATQDWLVQWDHGAPGVSACLLRAWRAFGVVRYKEAALKALDVTWKRGLVIKGLMACHGISGNTWMQIYASQLFALAGNTTLADKFAYRAVQFQEIVLAHPLLSDLAKMRKPQPVPSGPWQFWTGSIESAIMLWTDLVFRGPSNATHTGWAAGL